MSEKTGTFDAAINHLANRLNSRGEGSEREELRQAIRVLEDWPKWKPLIEAAERLTTGDLDWLRVRTQEIEEYAPIPASR